MNLAKLLVAIGATTTGFQRSMAAAERRVDGLERRAHRLRRTMGRAAGGMTAFAKKAMFVGGVALLAVTAALGGATSAAINYEDAFAGVRKTVEATEPQLQQLSKDIRDLSTEIPISATELAGLGETAGALGVQTKNLKEFIRVTALLGVTTDLTAQQAAESLGVLGNVLGLTATDYSRFGSALVALGNAGASTESQIIQIAQRSGAAAKLLGLRTDQILGFASAVASLGIEPEAAGTSLQTFFVKTLKFVSAGGKQLDVLAKTAGLTGKDFKRAFDKDAGGALLRFFKGMKKLSSAERLAVLGALGFNDSRITRALLGLSEGAGELERQLGVSADAWEKNTALTGEAEKRFATTKSQLELLKNILIDIAITLGDAILPVLTPFIKGLGDWIRANRDLIGQLAGNLARGISIVVGAIVGWVSANWPLIRQLGGALVGVLTTVWTVISTQVVPALFGGGGQDGIIPALVALGSKVADWLVPKVQAFIDMLAKPGGVADSIGKVAGPVITTLLDALGSIVAALFEGPDALVPAIGRLIGVLWDDGKGPLADAVRNIGYAIKIMGIIIAGAATEVGKLVNSLSDLIELKPGLEDIANLLRNLPFGGPLSLVFDEISKRQPDVPHRALGGPVTAWRPYKVGERGDEWFVPRVDGDILPHGQAPEAPATRVGESGGGDTYVTNNISISGPSRPMTPSDIARKMRQLATLGYFEPTRGGQPA